MTGATLFLLGSVLALAIMASVFGFARRVKNFSIVDIAWSLNFTPIALLYAILGPGDLTRRALVALMVTFWSLRLGHHLWKRIAALHPIEEGRYIELRQRWAHDVEGKFFQFFMIQGALNAFLSLPFLFACVNGDPLLRTIEIVGVFVFVVSLVGESAADSSLNAFRERPDSRGRVCRDGLWRYSRHPNYFFEWLIWCAFALVASAAPWGFVAWSAPALMLYFLFRITGIPATEEQALRSRGDAYREYQRTTSVFVPWFRRKP